MGTKWSRGNKFIITKLESLKFYNPSFILESRQVPAPDVVDLFSGGMSNCIEWFSGDTELASSYGTKLPGVDSTELTDVDRSDLAVVDISKLSDIKCTELTSVEGSDLTGPISHHQVSLLFFNT